MVGISGLYLPILLSAVFVFIASSIIHMALPWHKGDYPGVAREDDLRAALGPMDLPAGDYMVPRANSMEEMKSEGFREKLSQGPNLIMTVLPRGGVSMGRNLGLWFVYLLGVSFMAAYVAGRALPAGADYLAVFRFAATAAFLGYTAALWQMWIWYHRSLGTTIRSSIDGLIYALITAGTFGWLWPR
jgi:hypothetical protein